ncbi:MAG: signal peptidase II [Lachnospiraceae bacterium]|nr:signal peptidase II [Lachnospiraceae bacterium]
MNKRKSIILLIDVIFLAILIFLDQITKYFAIVYLKGQESLKVVDGVFEFNYLENRGAAFGMLQDQKFFFVFIAVVILAVIAYVLFKTPNQKKYTKLHIALVFIAAGAIGNMIDRLRFDYVVDFFYFSLINFPIFNVADIYVTCAAIYIVILLLFVYKESDLEFLSFRTKKFRDVK